MSEDFKKARDVIVSCRLCAMPVGTDATMCPSCGVEEPWIPDEPTLTPRIMRLLVAGSGLVLLGLLLFMSGVLMFGSPDGEHDHRPPEMDSKARPSR